MLSTVELGRLKEHIGDFETAWYRLSKLFSEMDEGDLNDIIENGYPFDESFDEMVFKVSCWYDEVADKVESEFFNRSAPIKFNQNESIMRKRTNRSRLNQITENIKRKVSPKLVSMKNLARAINKLNDAESDRFLMNGSYGINTIEAYTEQSDDLNDYISIDIRFEDGDTQSVFIYQDGSLYRMTSNYDYIDTHEDGVQLVTLQDIFRYLDYV